MHTDYNSLIFEVVDECDGNDLRHRIVPLPPGSLIGIGRCTSSSCSDRIAGPSNLLFDCKVMSRYHARIEAPSGLPGPVSVTDTSKYGTYLNDEKLRKGVMTPIHPGDKLRFGLPVGEIEPLTVYVDYPEQDPSAELLPKFKSCSTFTCPTESVDSEIDGSEVDSSEVEPSEVDPSEVDPSEVEWIEPAPVEIDLTDDCDVEDSHVIEGTEPRDNSEADEREDSQNEDLDECDIVVDTVLSEAPESGRHEWPTSSNTSLEQDSDIRVDEKIDLAKETVELQDDPIVFSETTFPSEAAPAANTEGQESNWERELKIANAQSHADLDRLINQSVEEFQQLTAHQSRPLVPPQVTFDAPEIEANQVAGPATDKRISIGNLINSAPAKRQEQDCSSPEMNTSLQKPIEDFAALTAELKGISPQPAPKKQKSNRPITKSYKITKRKAASDSSPRSKMFKEALYKAAKNTAYASMVSAATFAFLASPLAERLAAL